MALTLGALCGVGVASPATAVPVQSAVSAPPQCADGALSILAHPDDDLLFFNPHILQDIEARRCTRVVFVTAGESGDDQAYWSSLEAGIRATYAEMAGVANRWTSADAGISAGAISVHTLTAAPHVSVVFLRIPDGFDGSGSAAYGWQSLAKLWDGEISTVTTVDGRDWYTKTEVRNILVQLMTDYRPTTVRTQDWTSNPNNLDDHSDHWATAKFAQLASRRWTAPHTLLSYEGYPISGYDENVSGDDLAKITDAFVTFADYDKRLCNNPDEGCPDSPHDAWLERQYLVEVESTGNAARESGATVAVSTSASPVQGGQKANDGYPVGAPMYADHEWVTSGEKAGAWIQYAFAAPTALDGVTLFDRPNLADQITAATLVFSDGSTLPVGALPNNGSGLTVRFPVRTTTSVRLDVTGVSGTTTAVGLAEFETWRGAADTAAPVVTASPVGGTYPAGQSITLTANETASIYYTTDGTTPTTSSTKYSGPIVMSTGFTLRYIGVDAAGNISAPSQQAYTTPAKDTTPPVVTATPVGGRYEVGRQITLAANEPAKIYFTVDGSAPTKTSPVYAAPITLTAAFTLRYFGVDAAGNPSAVAAQSYSLPALDTTAPIVTANPLGGTYAAGRVISLSANEPARIHFTVDGSAPTTNSPVYSAPLTLSTSFQLRYFAVDTAGNPSSAASQRYVVRAPAVGPSHDFDGDGDADVLARDQAGNLLLQPGDGAGGWQAARVVGTGWNIMTAILMPGDFDGDGNADVLARDTGGRLFLYPGNGAGGWGARAQVGTGWNIMRSILGPGDFDGDGNVDVLAVDDGYRMLLYPGNGNGGWRTAVQVGSGWGTMSPVIAPGDFNGDGAVDVLARSAGVLYLYPGDGGGGWLPRVSVGTGWEPMTAMIGPGDFDGDGNVDVLGRTAAGALLLYSGNGAGGWKQTSQIGTGWNAFSAIT